MQAEIGNSKLIWTLSQLLAAQVGLFLDQSTRSIAKGTKHLFPNEAFLLGPGELFSEGIDKLAEDAGLSGVTPLMLILKAVFHFIRQRENADRQAEDAWSERKLDSFLLAYFAWWTDGGGSSTVQNIVDQIVDRLSTHTKDQQRLIDLTMEHLKEVRRFNQTITSVSIKAS